jgi:phosphonoacetaldehyde hydrolase
MGKKIKFVILDWAGTTVDFGSMAPVAAFRAAFGSVGLAPTDAQIRKYMGLPKMDHVRRILFDEMMADEFRRAHGRAPSEGDVKGIYARFEPALFDVLKDCAEPLPGVVGTAARLRDAGVKIGSTTGYTRAMMEVLLPAARANGYEPDCLVCPDDVGGVGRPYPYMVWENHRELGADAIGSVVKIGDTAADIAEGKNAGCISVGVVYGSNMMGVAGAEYEAAGAGERRRLEESARAAYRDAGADEIIERFSDIPALIESL